MDIARAISLMTFLCLGVDELFTNFYKLSNKFRISKKNQMKLETLRTLFLSKNFPNYVLLFR